MLLKVGQLAKQICLSIRTLHHYDEIGLLSPSVRTPAGHRLYNAKDIALLHRIQSLKQLGLSLQKITEIVLVTLLRVGNVTRMFKIVV
jgi:MerR family transcriptional regulator, thiopeptide resistance regulator